MRRPKLVEALKDKVVVEVAVGSLHCIACVDDGGVYTWGDNDEGQVGAGLHLSCAFYSFSFPLRCVIE